MTLATRIVCTWGDGQYICVTRWSLTLRGRFVCLSSEEQRSEIRHNFQQAQCNETYIR